MNTHATSAAAPGAHHPDQPLFLPIPRGGLTGEHVRTLSDLARYLAVDDGTPPETRTKTSLVEMQAFLNIAKTKNGGGRLGDCREALMRVAAIAIEAMMVLDVRAFAQTYPGAPLPAHFFVSIEDVVQAGRP